ncbi:hypothetical protein [Thioalkalivibrio sp. HK1]|nr:hypothetical protein [Thioalkalivibrio sp. HK1]
MASRKDTCVATEALDKAWMMRRRLWETGKGRRWDGLSSGDWCFSV